MTMCEHYFTLEPRDLLFMRDARPMEASDAGLGANLPRPDQLWNALINAFHRRWPDPQEWEGHRHHKRPGDKLNSSDRFGALKVCGPFPLKNETLYLPMPLDWEMELVPCGNTNLPAPLTYAFRDRQLGKKKHPQWISGQVYQKYLSGSIGLPSTGEERLWNVERNIGIAIDSQTRSAAEKKLYQAEYLRLEKGVTLWFSGSCVLKGEVDVLSRFDETNLLIGGQQGVAGIHAAKKYELPKPESISTRYLRWTLLTPAVFRNGWLPDWCMDSRKDIAESAKAKIGTVMLKEGQFAKLIAARIGKPSGFSGWDLQTGGPKPTQLAVPAGACYVFDCQTPENAEQLAKLLNPPNRRSSVFGEKGFGIGICSSIAIND